LLAFMTTIHQLSATELSEAYANGELSPPEVTRAILDHIDACEPRLNAMYLVHRESALQQAQAAEARWRKRAPLSPLDGVPITVKENIVTNGDPAPIGTAAADFTPKDFDAPPAARVREAGCVLLGKTTMPDYGMLSSGVSSLHGVTRNPWRLDRNPSGSSSGAGAAAAAGYGPLHLGTDIGGSVRLPATHCGVFGLKPSLGRVPIYPPFMARVTGPMTRNTRDAGLLMNVLTAPDARDFMSLPYEAIDFSNLSLEPRGLRIGLLREMKVGLPVHGEVAGVLVAAARTLEQAGAIVEEIDSFLTPEMLDGAACFFEARAYNDFSALPPERQAKVLPFIAEWCAHRAKELSGRDVIAALNQLFACREAAVRATQPFDYSLSPASPILPYEAELACPGNDPHNALPHIAFTVPWNLSEQPAASVNWSFSGDGLPLGVQIIGTRFDDIGVLRLARLIEQVRPQQRASPLLQ
jgi:aspartyl-tRNA(Asn)/glutamyl-tRNA(Gln) amidotransferase subunit A